ncbi:flagellar hook protein FlgE [Sporomusaceae bacterium BoRhaA]|uniref:flagellar hook-basal body complex protein n=1 Tax=Pelorhabdus rhamnosifermentans TaxID=2772457 RepID=UPI001C05EEEB|nr:flagellar hook-basal body complex protein [Pelorhabdus rhamnosifermentans]MBU2702556.1 flagellar hook protein FlgE [Pelorhabdus rhamnosifermentans]
MAMMNALSSAVTGLKTEQSALDVIANNIANVNTTGYKSQTVTFSDLLSQTISAASGATSTTGGVNAQQIGHGTQISSTETDMTVGTPSTTSNSTDVALTGAGYLIVQTGTKGDYEFTRNGSLSIDDDGNLNVNGYDVCGWEAYTLDSSGNKVYTTTGTVEPINVYSDDYSNNKKVMAATTTTTATVTGNASTSADVVTGATLKNIGTTTITTPDTTATINVIDEQGNKTAVTVDLKKCATDNTTTSWYWTASATDTTISPSSGYIAFDSDGNMVTSVTPLTAAITSATNTTGYSDSSMSVSTGLTAGDYTVQVAASTTSTGTYDITLTDPAGKTYTTTSTTGAATFTTSSGTVTLAAPTTLAAGTVDFTVTAGTTVTFDSKPVLTVTSTTAGTNAVPVTMDLSKMTSTGTTSSLTATADGNVAGTATDSSYTIAKDGTISVTYSNGLTRSVGQIALAVFQNASGLEKAGNSFYTASNSSGSYNTVVAGENGSGTMTSYALELSNVDLASQFSSMMISQRAYQANSKVISTGSQMLQSLISMVD